MSDLALHQAHADLAHAHDRFNALAQVAGREMPKFLKRAYTVPLTVGIAALGGAVEARFPQKGAIANAVLAGVAYGVGMLSGDNADLREGAYVFATGLGASAASIAAHGKVTTMLQDTTAPTP